MKVLVINGPNLNLLGNREPNIYGKLTLKEINQKIKNLAEKLKVEVEFFQSNHEGEIIEAIQKAKDNFEAIIINPAAYTHTSIGIYDALKAVNLPAVEVHLSHIYNREKFRQNSLIAPACVGLISGLGDEGYLYALEFLVNQYEKRKN